MALALLALVVAACTDEKPPLPDDGVASPAVTPSPSASATPGADIRCANQTNALAADARVGGEVSGDVDGDGSDDLVYVVRDESGAPGCQTFLVADTGAGVLATPTDEPGVSYALQAPRINSLVQVDGEGGTEILVDLEQGASTQFLGMFTLVDGTLRKVRIAGGSAYGDLFPYGGSVGHMEASNCSDEKGADVLIAMATPNATDYTIRTVLYEMNGATLVPLPRSAQPPIATGGDVQLSAGFDSSPFGDCRTTP